MACRTLQAQAFDPWDRPPVVGLAEESDIVVDCPPPGLASKLAWEVRMKDQDPSQGAAAEGFVK